MRITNEMLAQYLETKDKIAALTKELETLRVCLKAKGSFSTSQYIVSVKELTRHSLPGIEEMKRLLGEDLINPFIKVSSYETVEVIKKSKSSVA